MAQAQKKNQAQTGKSTARKTPAKSNAKKGTASRNTKNTKEERLEPALKKELVILAGLAAAVLLFCSNLHWCGAFGEALYRIMRGSFGIFGYIFPFYLFFAVCFLLSNKGSVHAVIRILVSFVVLVSVCGIASILAMDTYDSSMALKDYFAAALGRVDGGMFGGLCLRMLYPFLGVVGAYVVLILLTVAGLVVTTEKSVLRPIQKGGKKAYDTAREDMQRRHEIRLERAEERKKLRAENKVRGVSMDTEIRAEEPPEKAEKVSPKEERKPMAADLFTGEIHGMVDRDTEEAVYVDETEPLRAVPLKRTLAELDAMERQNTEEAVLDDGALGPLFRLRPAGEELPWEEKPADRPEPEPAEEADEVRSEEQKTAVPEKTEQPDSEVRRIVTASGKVIEVEEDPTEKDPITEKRAANRNSSIFREEGSTRGSSGSVRFTEGTAGTGTAAKTGAVAKAGSAGETHGAAVQSVPAKKLPRPYVKPPVRLLKAGTKKMKNRDTELKETAVKLQQTLQNFGVGVTVTNISCGPSVTRYELTPEQGVKVSRIVALTDDIKLNLAAADVRIEAPIPGKSAVGIEVPNKENMTVSFRDVMESEEFQSFPSKLAFAVGRDIAGQTVVTDLARMPHLLIAGATGSGKSVCINTLIMSILYKADPSEVKLIMIDPKVVELSVYNGIPHLMIPVVTDPKKAAGALNWAVAEMTDRYKKFAELNVRDLKGYNEKIKDECEEGQEAVLLPQLVIIVDELSDLMMVAPGEVEDAICRLAQMARAAGIHLVLATQRPSVNVITGLIKANVPSRIAFSVSSGVDSRTIIDMNGAEKLLGKGDMLFYPSGYQKPVRVQGAFISDEEVSRVVKFLTDNTDAEYSQDIESRLNVASSSEGAGGGERDAYFADAGRFLIEKEKGSIGMIQRAFKVGFNRAARIMEQLADAGVVGEEEGTKPRKILMTLEEFEEFLQQS